MKSLSALPLVCCIRSEDQIILPDATFSASCTASPGSEACTTFSTVSVGEILQVIHSKPIIIMHYSLKCSISLIDMCDCVQYTTFVKRIYDDDDDDDD